MAEPVEVAVESALLTKAQAFAAAQSPPVTISLPNVAFTPPPAKSTTNPVAYGKYLRATFMPAPSFELGIGFSANNQHYGILQLDVFWGQGAGEYAPGRLASAAIAYFARGTRLIKDGFTVQINKQPYRDSLINDDPWMMIPVSIPYIAFAPPA
jgi:hypothetical protein